MVVLGFLVNNLLMKLLLLAFLGFSVLGLGSSGAAAAASSGFSEVSSVAGFSDASSAALGSSSVVLSVVDSGSAVGFVVSEEALASVTAGSEMKPQFKIGPIVQTSCDPFLFSTIKHLPSYICMPVCKD